jgi:glycerol-1-phosphatase
MLWGKYDLLILDLDGVVYIGESPVPYAIESLNEVSAIVKICAATNNASRTPKIVAEHLVSLGLEIGPSQIYTSAQAGAALLSDRISEGSEVLVVGGEGVSSAIQELGFIPVRADMDPHRNLMISNSVVAVIQGHGTENNWWDFNTAMQAISNGAIWVATNRDETVPVVGGFGPGNGSFVAILEKLTGVSPIVAGKPEPALFLKAANYFGSTNPLVIGDRFDTDIDGATRTKFDSLLVQTGVHRLDDRGTNLPTYYAPDLRVLLEVDPTPWKV